jgi:hypothetical protein
MNPDRATPEPSLRSLVTERFHGNGTAVEALEIVERHGATVTATLLVCTHRRFERCARTLMRDLAASGLLDEGELGELADALLWEDRIAFAVPARWIASPLPTGGATGPAAARLVEQGSATARQTLPYQCRPPAAARRWAATWLLRHDATQVEQILAWAGRFDTGAGGAVVSGVLDAAASLSAEQLEPARADGTGVADLVGAATCTRRDGGHRTRGRSPGPGGCRWRCGRSTLATRHGGPLGAHPLQARRVNLRRTVGAHGHRNAAAGLAGAVPSDRRVHAAARAIHHHSSGCPLWLTRGRRRCLCRQPAEARPASSPVTASRASPWMNRRATKGFVKASNACPNRRPCPTVRRPHAN